MHVRAIVSTARRIRRWHGAQYLPTSAQQEVYRCELDVSRALVARARGARDASARWQRVRCRYATQQESIWLWARSVLVSLTRRTIGGVRCKVNADERATALQQREQSSRARTRLSIVRIRRWHSVRYLTKRTARSLSFRDRRKRRALNKQARGQVVTSKVRRPHAKPDSSPGGGGWSAH